MNVWRTSRTRAAGEGTTTASSQRNKCSHAGRNSTTSLSFIPNGDDAFSENHKGISHRDLNEEKKKKTRRKEKKRFELDFILTCPDRAFKQPHDEWQLLSGNAKRMKKLFGEKKKTLTIIGPKDWGDVWECILPQKRFLCVYRTPTRGSRLPGVFVNRKEDEFLHVYNIFVMYWKMHLCFPREGRIIYQPAFSWDMTKWPMKHYILSALHHTEIILYSNCSHIH